MLGHSTADAGDPAGTGEPRICRNWLISRAIWSSANVLGDGLVDKSNDRSILRLVSKGEETRQAILAKAFSLATVHGVSGVSIGRLAEETGLSKSGLFAPFGSKEALEVAVVKDVGFYGPPHVVGRIQGAATLEDARARQGNLDEAARRARAVLR